MNKYMIEALEEAKKAAALGEIPVGAIIEKDGEIVGRGHNINRATGDITEHAEMVAIRQASKKIGWRLVGCNMYVTMEPCPMCAGAMVWARIDKLFIGTMDPKTGACGSVLNIVQEPRLNHQIEVETGIMQEECQKIVKEYFQKLRAANKARQMEQEDNK